MLNMGLDGRVANSYEGKEIASITYKRKVKHRLQPLGRKTLDNVHSRHQKITSKEIICLTVSFLNVAGNDRVMLVYKGGH